MGKEPCADCGAFELQPFTEAETFNYKGQLLTVDVEYAVCTRCGAEAILPDQIKRNDCRLREAWRKADGLLTGAEIVQLRKKLGLTQQEAAMIFGGGVNAFSKYERGEVIQSEAMDKLLRLALEETPVNVLRWLCQRAGLTLKPKERAGQGYGTNVVLLRREKSMPLIRESTEPFPSASESETYREARYG